MSTVVVFEPVVKRIENLSALERVTAAAFSQRRKMLRSSLGPVFGDKLPETLDAACLDQTDRAETVSVSAYLKLADAV